MKYRSKPDDISSKNHKRKFIDVITFHPFIDLFFLGGQCHSWMMMFHKFGIYHCVNRCLISFMLFRFLGLLWAKWMKTKGKSLEYKHFRKLYAFVKTQ